MRIKVLVAASFWLFGAISVGTSATEINPVSNSWYLFDVDTLVSQSGGTEWIDAQVDESLDYVGDGSPLTFSFSLTTSSILNLVDAGISGDVFSLSINDKHYTSYMVGAGSGLYAGTDFDSAWATADFSRLSVLLAPGDYKVTGFLQQSAVDELGSPYLATLGGLQIVEADEPGLFVLLSIGMLTFILRRHSRGVILARVRSWLGCSWLGFTSLKNKGVLV